MKNEYKKSEGRDTLKTATQGKNDVNLKDHHGLFFQVGLVIVLGLVLFALEYKTVVPQPKESPVMDVAISDFTDAPPLVRMEMKNPKPVKKAPVAQSLPPKVVPEDQPVTPDEIFNPAIPTTDSPVHMDDLAPEPDNDEIEEYNIETVERVPVYPGCEGLDTNAERKACLQQHLKELIMDNFDTDAVQPFAKNGLNRINVQFTVDQNGKITAIKTRAANAQLEREARRVLSKVPQMQAGSKGGKKVKVIYAQPILFMLED